MGLALLVLRRVGFSVGQNGSFVKLGFSVGLCGFANVPFTNEFNIVFFVFVNFVCAVAEFQFLCGGQKIKHERSGNECRLTRCPFVVSFLCPCSLVKMVYFLFMFWLSVQCSECRLTIGYNGWKIGDGADF